MDSSPGDDWEALCDELEEKRTALYSAYTHPPAPTNFKSSPSSPSKALASGLGQLQLDLKVAEDAYQSLHDSLIDRLALSTRSNNIAFDVVSSVDTATRGMEPVRRDRWRATVLRILEGRLALESTSDGVLGEVGLTVGGILEATGSDMGRLLHLVLLVLDLRALESEQAGMLLDPMARSLRTTIRRFIYKLLTPPTSPLSSAPLPPTSVVPTEEQLVIQASPTTPGVTQIRAFAGTGKTTALLLFARAKLSSRGPPPRILYCCFNKALKLEAEKKFGGTIKCLTTNGIAFRHLCSRTDFIPRFKNTRGGMLQTSVVVRILSLVDKRFPVPAMGGQRMLRAKSIASRIIRCLDRFAGSISATVEASHVVRQRTDSPCVPDHELLHSTRELWDYIKDVNNSSAPIPFSLHVKLCLIDTTFALEEDVILYDEAQDSNDADLELIVRQRRHARIVLVGDEHQAIYGWRGGYNTWLDVQADHILRLSESFRFGSQIANVANTLLEYKKEEQTVTGNATIGRVYRPMRSDELPGSTGHKWTVLHRTNRGLIHTLFALTFGILSSPSARPPQIALRVNSQRDAAEPLRLYFHAHDLATGRLHPTTGRPITRSKGYEHRHPRLAEFETWEDLVSEVDSSGQDLDVEDIVLAEWKKPFRDKLERASRCIVAEEKYADIVLGVTHQIKGLEWENVILGDDYVDCFESSAFPLTSYLSEELNLLYVALTRAKAQLVLHRPLFRLLLLEQGLHHFTLERNPSLCMQCFTPISLAVHYATPFPHLIPSALDSDLVLTDDALSPADSDGNLDDQPQLVTPPPSYPGSPVDHHVTPKKRPLSRSSSPESSPSRTTFASSQIYTTPSSSPNKRRRTDRIETPDAPPPEDAELDTSMFPACLACARTATYPPLRQFAEFWTCFEDAAREGGARGWDDAMRELARLNLETTTRMPGAEAERPHFAGFARNAAARAESIGNAVLDEIGMTSFFGAPGSEGEKTRTT